MTSGIDKYTAHVRMSASTIALHRVAFMHVMNYPQATPEARARALVLYDQYTELFKMVQSSGGVELHGVRIGDEDDEKLSKAFI